jgi:outer membrane protein OmpA-like peptidoglycan-associated protein
VICFDVDSAVIQEEVHRELTWFVGKMRPCPKGVIQVRGFASEFPVDTNETMKRQLNNRRVEVTVR